MVVCVVDAIEELSSPCSYKYLIPADEAVARTPRSLEIPADLPTEIRGNSSFGQLEWSWHVYGKQQLSLYNASLHVRLMLDDLTEAL